MIVSKPDTAELNLWLDTFPSIAQSSNLTIDGCSADNAEISEAYAARFLLALLRQRPWLKWRFPRALSEGERGRFCRWLLGCGEGKFGLSPRAMKKIRGAFRRKMGKRVYDIYLNDPDLQQSYPLGLLPIGQLHFLGWLTSRGRADRQLTDEQILWFLQESTEDLSRGVSLTYLLNPTWQKEFPLALTTGGWAQFRRWLIDTYGKAFCGRELRNVPAVISFPNQVSLRQSVSSASFNSALPRLEGVNIFSHFCNPCGIQQAALWAKTALERAGLRTSCRDVPVPRLTLPIDRAEWLGLEIFPLTILNQAATPYFISGYERSGLLRREGVYHIAYWNWELEKIPDVWLEAVPLIDEIWSPTEFVAKAMRSRMPLPVYRMFPGVEIGPIEPVPRARFGIPDAHCVFLFMFDLHSQIHRKNPLGVIRAFEKAFRADDRATLVIKAIGGDIHIADLAALQAMTRVRNVILVHEAFSRAAAYGMVDLCDCFISLHRAEGFGLGMAEAMLMAKPVIATGYSGNLDFMNNENSMLVDYKIVDIGEDRPLYTKGNFWAEPSIDHAAYWLRQVYENREEAAARAKQNRPAIRETLSLDAAGARMADRLRQIMAPRGWDR